MSEPKRFNFSATIVHHIGGEKTAALKYHTEPDGLFVSYEDYARLKAEVERLTKAGDNLVFVVTEHPVAEPFVKAWFSAKEGKPRA
jgi:hypothetical protein